MQSTLSAHVAGAEVTTDLRWSKLNPTLYSLCFAGKAKRHVFCSFSLSDNHPSEQCPENQERFGAMSLWHNQSDPSQQVPLSTPTPYPPPVGRAKLCYLFNAREGPWCTFQPCKYVHRCCNCRGF
jgi:hypothetical protein